MRFFKDTSIRRKQMLAIMLTSAVVLFLACAAFVAYDTITFRQHLVGNVSTLADAVGNNCVGAIDFNDAKAAGETLAALRANGNIVSACLYSRDGNVFALYQRDQGAAFVPPAVQAAGQKFEEGQLHLFRQISQKDEMVGTIFVASDMQDLSERLTRYLGIVGVVFLVSLLVALALSNLLQRLVSDPLLKLARVARSVATDKNYSLRATKHGADEIGQLVDGFNEMLVQIQQRDAALQAANDHLESRVTARTAELAESLSVLDATLGSTTDGILVVNGQGKKIFQNQRTVELWKIPPDIAESIDDMAQVQHVMNATVDPGQFREKVAYFYAHPDESGQDEIRLKDGTILDRLTAPVLGKDGKNYGRIWMFRDVTQSRKYEAALLESQALYHSLVDQMPAGIFRKDAAGRYVFANSWFCRTKGLTEEQLLGRKPEELATQNLIETKLAVQGENHHETIMATRKPIEVEEEFVEADGKTMHLHVVKSPVFGPKGNIVGTQGMLFDVTARKQAEAELSHERELLRALLDNSPDQIYFKDLQSRFLRTSRAQVLNCGAKNADELVGKTDFDLFTDDHARPAFEDEQKIIRTGQPMIGKVEKETWQDGHVTWALTSKMPLRDRDGRIIGTFGISKDITAIKEAELQLEQAHKQLVETSRQAGMAEIATNVLHNVGNVLNSVNVSTNLLVENVRHSRAAGLARVVALLNEHAQDLGTFITSDVRGRHVPAHLAQLSEHLIADQQAILDELDSLRRNVEHIKEIVAMQQSYATIGGVREMVDIVNLVEDSLRLNEGALTRHRVEVVREFAALPPMSLDKHKILQILINLLRNAKYACDESRRPDKKITIRVTANDGHLKITVMDNGVGILPENLTRIFNYGFTTRKNGHGFGLHGGALAAREMGGSLTVHSDGPGQGAAFTLDLPCRGEGGTHE